MRAGWLWVAIVGCGVPSEDAENTDVVAELQRPTKRSEVLAAVHEGTHQILMFGGNDGPIVSQTPMGVFLDETWVYKPGVGWDQLDTVGPSARGRYAISTDEAGGRALAFGGRFRKEGRSGDYKLFKDLWSFDFNTGAWTQLDEGTGPSARYYPASAWDDAAGLYYIWGGATNADPLSILPSDELWSWDGAAWTELETTGDKPSTRVFFGSTYDPERNRLVVFGGQKGDFQSLAYNDFYALDLDDLTWSRLHDGNGLAPSTRMHAHLAYDAPRDRYLLFGGHTDIGDLNDMWAFDPASGEWTEDYIADVFTGKDLGCRGNASEVPKNYVDMDLTAPERRHRGMFGLLDGSAWIFGGIHAECSDQLDDTWRYDLEGRSWEELMEATSGEACLRRNDDCQCLCL
jgi:hypothetical protein